MDKPNPFVARPIWRHWLVAVLVGAAAVGGLLLMLAKLGGYSNPPDVERAMQPPPKDSDVPTEPRPPAPPP